MLAALSLFPLAAAALAVALARPLARGERATVAVAAALFGVSALLAPQVPINDQWTHFVHARAVLDDPRFLIDLWDRPGFTLLYAAPAALGLGAARLTSGIPAAIAIAATIRAARALRLDRPWVAGLLLVAQYDFFGQASSTMTELPFAAALALAVWGWAEDRPWTAAAGLGWCAITRPEGIVFAAAGALGLLARHRRAGPAVAPLVPLVLWAVTGALAWRDALWWHHGNPYAGTVAPRLELRQLADSYFYEALRLGQPGVLRLLEGGGAILALLGPARRLRFLLAPLAIAFLVLTFLRIGATDAWRESRYLVAVAPALALLAAAGLDAALAAFPRLAPPVLLAAAADSAAGQILLQWRAAFSGAAWFTPAIYMGVLTLTGALWFARERIPPRPALALLLVLPLACAPPGAYGKLRPEPTVTAPAPPAG